MGLVPPGASFSSSEPFAGGIEPVQRPAAARLLGRLLAPLDTLFSRVYGSRWNPLHQSGTIAILLFTVVVVTGIYLFVFYRISDPHGSVQAIHAQWWGGRWIRSLHRYASDAALVAIVFHVLKMLVGGRTWGPRTLAWVSGVALVGVVLLCGWTGLVMAWDVQGRVVAEEGARLLDLLPLFSEPIARSFAYDEAVPRSFFFMNLFLHVALPLGIALFLWIHVSRIARPKLLPPRPITWGLLGLLLALSILWPVSVLPKADLTELPGRIPLDIFYTFWVPVALRVGPEIHLLLWVLAAVAAFTVPLWWRPRRSRAEPSRVAEALCTGCRQCYEDCPYEAIQMLPRTDPGARWELYARVDPALCVSCGLCVGSCAPMGIGPPGRDGREQVREARDLLSVQPPAPGEVVVLACGHGPAAARGLESLEGVRALATGCSGSVHTSVVEMLVRGGSGGVFLLTCPERDCLFREGPKWLAERLYHDREAELKERVDRRRVRLASFDATEGGRIRGAAASFREEIAELDAAEREEEIDLDVECERAQEVTHG